MTEKHRLGRFDHVTAFIEDGAAIEGYGSSGRSHRSSKKHHEGSSRDPRSSGKHHDEREDSSRSRRSSRKHRVDSSEEYDSDLDTIHEDPIETQIFPNRPEPPRRSATPTYYEEQSPVNVTQDTSPLKYHGYDNNTGIHTYHNETTGEYSYFQDQVTIDANLDQTPEEEYEETYRYRKSKGKKHSRGHSRRDEGEESSTKQKTQDAPAATETYQYGSDSYTSEKDFYDPNSNIIFKSKPSRRSRHYEKSTLSDPDDTLYKDENSYFRYLPEGVYLYKGKRFEVQQPIRSYPPIDEN